jgi:transketolase
MLEDIALMRAMPNMTVVVPGDAEEARKAVIALANAPGPSYVRFGRAPSPVFTTPETPFALGKALNLWTSEKPKVALIATGALSYEALQAARALRADGIESLVLHVPTIKPLDRDAVVRAAKAAGRVITLEEHQTTGGLGSAVAECLSEAHPVPVVRMGVEDRFGQSGTPEELLEHYKLTAPHVAAAARRLLGGI